MRRNIARHPKRQTGDRGEPDTDDDTSEQDGHYGPIRASPREGVVQIHTDCEIPQGGKIENKIRRFSRNTNKSIGCGSVPYTGILWDKFNRNFVLLPVQTGLRKKEHRCRRQPTSQLISCPEK